MTLLGTNVLIYASDAGTDHHSWAGDIITNAVDSAGAGLNPVSLAELCVGVEAPDPMLAWIQVSGIILLDMPSLAALQAAHAYRTYRQRRQRQSGKLAPMTPLPDFFIGAHAEVMGYSLATADASRFRTYFPSVRLILP